jgi:hypothetical protein
MATATKQYLLNLYQPVGIVPPPEFLEPVMRELDALNQEIRAAGNWVFTGALHQPTASTVVRMQDGEALTTDGPFAEGKEFIGGFWIVAVPDLDGALGWARRVAGVTGLPVEVRPFQDAGDLTRR